MLKNVSGKDASVTIPGHGGIWQFSRGVVILLKKWCNDLTLEEGVLLLNRLPNVISWVM
ncbi:hypothetical protein ACJIZ3_006882 [Penstemon smallii]|uniref:Uncharacterized protein n=1 Tax=Penstemon smallii TaxID=265156 RepID=A0ABD3S937_9LAMI